MQSRRVGRAGLKKAWLDSKEVQKFVTELRGTGKIGKERRKLSVEWKQMEAQRGWWMFKSPTTMEGILVAKVTQGKTVIIEEGGYHRL